MSDQKFDLYKHRELLENKISREVSWLQVRVTWHAAFQGFLFTAFALITKPIDEAMKVVIDTQAFIWVFPSLGIGLGIVTLSGVYASDVSISRINKDWDNVPDCSTKRLFSSVRQRPTILYLGRATQYLTPVLFCVAWGFILHAILI